MAQPRSRTSSRAMASAKKSTRSVRQVKVQSSRTSKRSKPGPSRGLRQRISGYADSLRKRRDAFLLRRPHRSFRRTRRRDYGRKLTLPGYSEFTAYVLKELKAHRRTFFLLVACYAILMVVLGGVTNQASYTQVSQLLQDSSTTLTAGGLDKIGQAGLLLAATFASGPSGLSADQQVYLAIVLLFVWLSSVWLLREYKVGRTPRLRDALYSSGAPFVSTMLILLILICQLLPIGVMALVYAALNSVGLVTDGFGSMLFWIIAAFIGSLVLYWVTSTLIALVIVTLPGMYPLRAMKAAGDLVVGRRLRIMYRILWMLVTVVVAWVVVMIPLILLTTWLGSIWEWVDNVPIMPLAAAMMSALTVVWASSYIYLLYRKVVDDGTSPS